MAIRQTFTMIMLFASFALTAAAQDDWSKAPAEELITNRETIARQILASTDEAAILQLWQRPETEEGILYLKFIAAKRLGSYGTKAAIPVLAAKLDGDPREAFYARYALEAIPIPEADDALIAATASVKKPGELAGVLTSLGVRENPKAAAAAKSFLKNENPDVRKAAGYAYAKTAGAEAIEFFTNKNIDPVLADNGFLLAEELVKNGDRANAVKIYDALAEANIEAYKKQSAIFWGIIIRSNDGIELLVKQLQSESPKLFAVGLKAARELPVGTAATQTLITQIGEETDTFRKSLLVRALGGSNGDASKALSLPVVTDLVKSGEAKIRVAAVDTLRFIGDSSSLPVLLAATKDEETKTAAIKTLEELPGKAIDDAVLVWLSSDDAATKVTAINLIQERRIKTDALKKELSNSVPAVRNAALNAFGQTATLAELPALLEVLAKTEGDADEIVNILKSACTRLPQDDASAEVEKLFTAGSESVKLNLLALLKEIGGKKAVEIVEQSAWSNDVKVQDKATEYLGNWRSPSDLDLIAAACLKLAKESPNDKYANRGLGGYLRLARQFNMPSERRLTMCSEVFALAKNDKLKAQVVDVYWRFPSPQMLAETVKYLDDSSDEVRQQACQTVIKLGEKLPNKSPEMKGALEKAVKIVKDNEVRERAKSVLAKQ
ncbi:hypothetical protein FACS1894189_2900 [Planctomycetales bacterium]|nr:hypothetical protein FACS1894189_2900 [Planctomycetales bacterium]